MSDRALEAPDVAALHAEWCGVRCDDECCGACTCGVDCPSARDHWMMLSCGLCRWVAPAGPAAVEAVMRSLGCIKGEPTPYGKRCGGVDYCARHDEDWTSHGCLVAVVAADAAIYVERTGRTPRLVGRGPGPAVSLWRAAGETPPRSPVAEVWCVECGAWHRPIAESCEGQT